MRDRALDSFLASCGWSDAQRHPLAGDASSRKYLRLTATDRTAILMDAPPEACGPLDSFLLIAEHLQNRGLSAPRILASDRDHGFLLLEDLGDDLFARVIDHDPTLETSLYLHATDLLLELQNGPVPVAPRFDGPTMADATAIAFEWYAGSTESTGGAIEMLAQLLSDHAQPTVLALRDFHAENLIWLPNRRGHQRVGLLDFQDAVIAHPCYDLVSLLKDARRDVSVETKTAAKRRFVEKSGADADRFELSYALVGAQRNLRILGVFARLSLHFGKPSYIDLIPRVWSHLVEDLAHPDLGALSTKILDKLPVPDHAHLESLRPQ